MSGTVNWFNVAKGFGAFQCRVSFVSLLIEIDAPRARVSPPAATRIDSNSRKTRIAHPFATPPRVFDVSARARAFFAALGSLHLSKKTSHPASFVFLTRPVRYPRLRVHHARRRSGRHLRAPVGHLLRGVPELTRRRARGVHAPGDRRRAIQSRARESSPRVKYSYPESVFFLRSARSPASRALARVARARPRRARSSPPSLTPLVSPLPSAGHRPERRVRPGCAAE